jgi:2'-5' RNA ligase
MHEDEPVTTYAVASDTWAPWHQKYLYGAFYLFPPDPVRERVNAWRTTFDPSSQAISEAHVSLTVPLPRPLTGRDAAEISLALATHAPLDLQWGPPWQYPGIPGVVLRIEPAAAVAALVTALESCAVFQGAPPRPYPFSPHMTVAEFVDQQQTEAILAALTGEEATGQWRCTTVSYAAPDTAFRFTTRRVWLLGEDATCPASPDS